MWYALSAVMFRGNVHKEAYFGDNYVKRSEKSAMGQWVLRDGDDGPLLLGVRFYDSFTQNWMAINGLVFEVSTCKTSVVQYHAGVLLPNGALHPAPKSTLGNAWK